MSSQFVSLAGMNAGVMTATNSQRALVLFVIAFLTGVAVGAVAIRYSPDSGEYSVLIMNEYTALRINKRTGQTWRLNRQEGSWEPVRVSNESGEKQGNTARR